MAVAGQLGRAVIRGTILLFVCRMLAILLGFLQLVILAERFGAGPESDAYLVASSIFFMLVSGMEGTFAATFVPIFMEYRQRSGEEKAWAMARSLLHLLVLCASLVWMILVVFAPFVATMLAPGLSQEDRVLCGGILRLLSPLVLLFPLNALLSSIHYCYQRFGLGSSGSLLPPIGGVLALTILSNRLGIMALPLGLVVMSFIQFGYLLWGLGPKVKELARLSLNVHEGVRRLGRLAPPRFLGLSLMRFDLMVDRFFASYLGVGFVTAVTYGGKLPSMTAGTIAAPLMKGFIPVMSTLSAEEDKESISAIVSRGLRTIVVILLPLGVFLIVYGEDIIGTLFEHGAFGVEATRLTAYPLTFYSLGLLFYGVNPLLRGTFFVLKDTVTPLRVGIVASTLNVFLNVALIRYFAHGGIALATTLVALYSTVSLYLLLKQKGIKIHGAAVANNVIRPACAAVVMGIVLKLTRASIADSLDWNIFVLLVLQFVVGASIYAGVCALLGVRMTGAKETMRMTG